MPAFAIINVAVEMTKFSIRFFNKFSSSGNMSSATELAGSP